MLHFVRKRLSVKHLYTTVLPACLAAGLQAGKVVAYSESVDRNHRANDGRTGQPLLRTGNHSLHVVQ